MHAFPSRARSIGGVRPGRAGLCLPIPHGD